MVSCYLITWMEECELRAINTKLQKKKGKLWTFQYPNGAKSQLDYICINRKWQNSAQDCNAFSFFYSIGSDHRVVTAKLRLSLRATKVKTKRTPKYDWRKFGKDTDLQQLYAVEVENQFSALCSLHDEENLTADQKYPLFIKAHNKAASKTLPERKRKQGSKVSWQDDSVVTARNQLNAARKQYN